MSYGVRAQVPVLLAIHMCGERGFAGAADLGLSPLGFENFCETGELLTLLVQRTIVLQKEET